MSSKLVGGWKLQGKLNSARDHNNNARTKVVKVNDTFHHYAYKSVLIADNFCPTATANTVCTTDTNNALQSVIDTLDLIQFPPDFTVPNVFLNLRNFMSLNLKIINILSMERFIKFLRPVYDWLIKRRCFSINLGFWGTLGPWCFSIKDIFDNWLVGFVSGIIDFFLKPFLIPIKTLFEGLGLALPSLPSLSLPLPRWAVPSFSIDFDASILNLPCLEYDYTAKAVYSKCFDFPSLKLPTPLISNPLSFACDEGCDSSCDSSQQIYWANRIVGRSCHDSCDSSCDFVATCGSSRSLGRRLEDRSDAITAEPKAIGWSERLAAAAAQEGK